MTYFTAMQKILLANENLEIDNQTLSKKVEMLEAQVKFFQEDLVAANEIIKSPKGDE